MPYVDLATYGHANACGIAAELRELCRRALGCDVAAALFYQASIGAVAGLELEDGRRVVVKAHQPDMPVARLAEVAALQRVLAARDLYAPASLAGPLPFARGHALIEAFDDRGEPRDGHEPAVRRALARSLHQVVSALEPYVSGSSLPAALIASAPAGALWPTPHSKLFDFEATRRGAEATRSQAPRALA